MNKNLEKELADIFTEYSSNLPNKLLTIENLWKKYQESQQVDVLDALRTKVHSLRGSAGIFGYSKTSEIAEKLELLLTDSNNNFTEEQKNTLNKLFLDLIESSKLQSQAKGFKINKKPILQNELIFILDIGNQIDNSNLDWAAEITKKLNVFGYVVKHFMDFSLVETEINDKPPLVLLVNLDLLDKEGEKQLQNLTSKLQIPILFFSNSGEFNLRMKAVGLEGKGFLVKPFLIDELLYELNRIQSIDNDIYRVLIIDDEVEVANYHATILNHANVTTKVVTQIEEVDKILHEFTPELILIDYYMPVCNGKQLAAIIRQQRVYEFIPIIFLSSEEDKTKQLNAMSVGGDEFITKKIDPNHLIVTVKNKAYRYKILRTLITKDSLTEALSASAILKELDTSLAEAKGVAGDLSIAIIEINDFSEIVSKFGNSAGDQILKSLSLMLRNRTRISDIIGRYNETKFLIIFPNTSLDEAEKMIKDLEKHFVSLTYFFQNQIFNTTFSAGLASSSLSGFQANNLIQVAIAALTNNPVKVI